MVIQGEKYAGNLPTVLVVPLTSTQKALRFAGTTAIVATAESGLRNDSVALVFQCLAIDRNHVGQRMGQASESEKANVPAEMAKLTGQSE
jgi:mRNA interferase MazF